MNHREETTLSCHALWRKSSRSGGEGQCIEITSTLGHIFVRDSKSPTGPMLTCNQSDWSVFLRVIKIGELDFR